MANEIDLTVQVETDEAQDSIEKLNKEIDKTDDNLKDVSKTSTKASKGVSKFGKAGKAAMKGIGTAVKAIGIGILIGLFAAVFDVLSKNQKVLDLFETVMGSIGIVVNKLVSGFGDMFSTLEESTNGFDSMKAVIVNLIKIGLTPLKIGFETIKLALNIAQLAWEKSFFGGGDKGKIAELKASIIESEKTIIKLGVEAAKSGIEVAKNIGGAISEVAKVAKATVAVVTDVTKELVDGSIVASATAAAAATKAFDRLNIERDKLQLSYEMEAEKLRQLRDDTSLTIEERIAANKKLGELLAKQGEEELLIVEQQIAATKTRIAIEGDNVEIQNELLELANKKLDIENRITGQFSEQKTNINSLKDEQITALEEVEEKRKEIRDAQKEEAEEAAEKLIELNNNKREATAKQDKIDIADKKKKADEEIKQRKGVADASFAIASMALGAISSLTKRADARAIEEANGNEEKIKEIKRKAFIRDKAIAVGQSLINTALGVTSALTIPVGGIPLSIAVGAAGAIQTGIIAAEPMPKFAQSGVLESNGSTQGDGAMFMGNDEEIVLDKFKQKNMLKVLGQGGGGVGLSEERVAEIATSVVKAIPVYIVESAMTESQKTVSVRESRYNVK